MFCVLSSTFSVVAVELVDLVLQILSTCESSADKSVTQLLNSSLPLLTSRSVDLPDWSQHFRSASAQYCKTVELSIFDQSVLSIVKQFSIFFLKN